MNDLEKILREPPKFPETCYTECHCVDGEKCRECATYKKRFSDWAAAVRAEVLREVKIDADSMKLVIAEWWAKEDDSIFATKGLKDYLIANRERWIR